MKRKPSIFEFNHISRDLTEQDIDVIKDFYKHYHKKFWCSKKSYKRFILDESITITGNSLMIIGTITGEITLNPIVFGVINGVGILITNTGRIKNCKKNILMSKIAFTTYEKVLVELRSTFERR